ncbi:hypothetical protein [Mesorhizobium sp. B2-8-5]|uniref:hypothetical protein n=1 Tax=Mesorhizobium sp. B2-8-5 TaxID=2589903 RepID=UPI00112C9BAC|nr:hypothetical protein [Mesorhizobium sp. B2-8-5]UCI23971.1 hypothetical protein FJ430_20450 [Mesorhizobium sp. B2-8-5]
MRTIAVLILSFLVYLRVCPDASADPFKDELIHKLAHEILGSDSFFRKVGDGGWRGIALAPAGASIEPLVQAYSGQPGDVFDLVVNNEVFGRTISIENGVVFFKGTTIADAWRRILDASAPYQALLKDRTLPVPVMQWLFRPVTRQAKIIYTREPSRYVLRYREYEKKHLALMRSRNDGIWKLLPGFSQYATFSDAESAISEEWIKSGYKAEVESAYSVFLQKGNPAEWNSWFIANERFKNNMEVIHINQSSPLTYLLPPPASWSTVSSWVRMVLKVPSLSGEFRFQLARVKILRPWFDVDALLDHRIGLNVGPADVVVSTDIPEEAGYAGNGILPGFVEELLLVRDIHFVGDQEQVPTDHPLAKYAYPDSINLLGYVVYTMPQIRSDAIKAPDDGSVLASPSAKEAP